MHSLSLKRPKLIDHILVENKKCFLRILSSYPECLEDISIPDSCVLLCTTAAPGKFAVLVTLAILMSLQKRKKIMPTK